MRQLVTGIVLLALVPVDSWAKGPAAPVADWRLDEGMGVFARDKTPNRNHGKIHGAEWAKQATGHALQFDGKGDYVDCGARESLDITRAVTLEAWIAPARKPDAETAICGKSQVSYALTHYRNGHAYFYISAGSNGVQAPIEYGAWLHLVGTFDGATLNIYVNGRLAASRESNEKTIQSGGNFLIGRLGSIKEYGDLKAFSGKIDAVRVYNRALTAEEIVMQYKNEFDRYEAAADEGWKAVAEGVRTEAVPSRLEGRGGRQTEIQQAAAYGATEKDGALVFHITGNVPHERTMKWKRSLAKADRTPASYTLLRYRAEGIRRSFSVFPVVKVAGRDAKGLPVSAILLDCTSVINDGLPHVVLGKLPEGFTPRSAEVEVSTTSSRAQVTLESLTFSEGLPQLDLSDARGKSVPAPGGKFAPLDLRSQYNDTLAAALERQMKDPGAAVDPVGGFDRGEFILAGVPFSAAATGKDFIRPPEDMSVNQQIVEVEGVKAPREIFMPFDRETVTEVPINRAASEIFLILIAEAPVTVGRYSRPTVPFHLDDIEAFALELVYADGESDLAFPYSLADEGFVIRRMAGAYAVPADPDRLLKTIRLHNRTWGTTVGLAAATVNPGPNRLLPELAADPRPIQPPQLPEPAMPGATRAAFVRQDGTRIVCGNRFYTLSLDTAEGFALTEIRNLYNPGAAIALDPSSGLEVVAGGRVLAGRDFTADSVKTQGRTATITLNSKDPALPLRLRITVSVDDGPQITLNCAASNTGQKPIAATIRFPVLKGLRIGSLDDTWIFFPKYLNVLTNRPGYHAATNDRAFPMQFYDVHNPRAGIGLTIITHNLAHAPFEYSLAKDAQGVTARIDYPAEYYPIPPGQTVQLTETCLVPHAGDWHQALQIYKDWLATWYKPRYARNREWFDRLFFIRAEATSTRQAKRYKIPVWLYTGTPGKFRVREIVAASEENMGLRPDLIHVGSWFHTAEGEEDSWGDYNYTEAGVGGLDSFRSLISELRDDYDLPISLYMIPDRASRKTEVGKRLGEKAVSRRPNGSAIAGADEWCMCVAHPEWRDYFVEAVQRVQRDTQARAMYLDVFSFYKGHQCHAKDHGHPAPFHPNKATYDLITRVREALPPDVPLWSEYPLDDVSSQYHDGSIAYYYLTLHSLFAQSHDVDERAALYDEPMLDTYRFALPHLKQLCFPVGIEHDRNWGRLKFIFLNGEALFDCTYRIFRHRTRAMFNRAISLQRKYADCFTTRQPEMLVPTERAHLYANKFPAPTRTLWTLYNARYTTLRGPVLSIPHRPGATYHDAWNERKLTPRILDNNALLTLTLPPQSLGCIVQQLD